MSIVAVDNQVLVWGVRRRAAAGQEAMIERAAHLLDRLKDEGATVVVPSPVLAEHLVPVPLDEHPIAIEALANCAVRIYPLDTPAAALAAAIFQEAKYGARPVYEELQREGLTRQVVKVDMQIVAIAIVRQARVLYSEDDGIHSIASRVSCVGSRLAVERLPVAVRQLPLIEG